MIKLDIRMPHSCAACFACERHGLTHSFRCRLTEEELPEIEFYDLLAKKIPKMKNCQLQEDNSELKPCPFCGSAVEIKKIPMWREDDSGKTMSGYKDCYELKIYCSKCGCTTANTSLDTVNITEEQAKNYIVKKWNTRYN